VAEARAGSPERGRPGNAVKRAEIISAARRLFVRDGVERTSMDAIAAEAGVSKRTVYDYYGDKHGLLVGVVTTAGDSLLRSMREAIDAHLSDHAAIADSVDIERAFVRFAVELGRSAIANADFAATLRLIAENRADLAELKSHPLAEEPEKTFSERISHFASLGLLDADDPREAADHFMALTMLRAVNLPPDENEAAERIDAVMASGARVFVRAYETRRH
jgi:TetR/AcrR family transcriptional regulator, mexJK operon transcriptional repressor